MLPSPSSTLFRLRKLKTWVADGTVAELLVRHTSDVMWHIRCALNTYFSNCVSVEECLNIDQHLTTFAKTYIRLPLSLTMTFIRAVVATVTVCYCVTVTDWSWTQEEALSRSELY